MGQKEGTFGSITKQVEPVFPGQSIVFVVVVVRKNVIIQYTMVYSRLLLQFYPEIITFSAIEPVFAYE